MGSKYNILAGGPTTDGKGHFEGTYSRHPLHNGLKQFSRPPDAISFTHQGLCVLSFPLLWPFVFKVVSLQPPISPVLNLVGSCRIKLHCVPKTCIYTCTRISL